MCFLWCALGPLETSALGGNTPAPLCKIRCFLYCKLIEINKFTPRLVGLFVCTVSTQTKQLYGVSKIKAGSLYYTHRPPGDHKTLVALPAVMICTVITTFGHAVLQYWWRQTNRNVTSIHQRWFLHVSISWKRTTAGCNNRSHVSSTTRGPAAERKSEWLVWTEKRVLCCIELTVMVICIPCICTWRCRLCWTRCTSTSHVFIWCGSNRRNSSSSSSMSIIIINTPLTLNSSLYQRRRHQPRLSVTSSWPLTPSQPSSLDRLCLLPSLPTKTSW